MDLRKAAFAIVATMAFMVPTETRAQAETALAREVHAGVERRLGQMKRVGFTSRRPGVQFRSEVKAWTDGAGIRKVEAIDRDDSGDVITEYYYAKGALVFAFQAVRGFNAAGKQATRIEQRQYFGEGRMFRWLGGLEKAEIPVKDPAFARESKARLAESAFYLRGAKAVSSKKTEGTLMQLVNGDVACYLTLKDERGVEFTEMGDFEICFQKPSPLNKRVRLAYGYENVMADECRGDVDCGKSQRVALVESARILD